MPPSSTLSAEHAFLITPYRYPKSIPRKRLFRKSLAGRVPLHRADTEVSTRTAWAVERLRDDYTIAINDRAHEGRRLSVRGWRQGAQQDGRHSCSAQKFDPPGRAQLSRSTSGCSSP